jgi:hypothetical protein
MRSFAALIGLTLLTSCREYHLDARITDQAGLVPADQYARYGREQTEEVAIAREFGHAGQGSSPEQRRKQAEAAMAYARSLPDVVGAKADAQGLLLTVQFKSGWRTMVIPLNDGKRGAETMRVPASGAATGKR